MYIAIDTIQYSADSAEAKDLAAFLWFKSKYSNSCYFKWSLKSIADKTKVSRTVVRKYIQKFIELGWCRVHGKNLIFKKTSELYLINTRKLYVKINLEGSMRDILEELFLALLKRKANQFDFVKQLWGDKRNGNTESVGHYKKIQKFCKGREVKQSAIQGFSYSLSKCANLFNTSIPTTSRILRSLYKKGKFVTVKNSVVLGSIKKSRGMREALNHVPGAFVSSSGLIIKKLCNSYIF